MLLVPVVLGNGSASDRSDYEWAVSVRNTNVIG